MTKRVNQISDWYNVTITQKKKEHTYALAPYFMLAFVVLTCLKLAGVIGWSWWAVTAPLWGPIAFVVGLIGTIFAVCVAIALICAIAAGIVMLVSGIAQIGKN